MTDTAFVTGSTGFLGRHLCQLLFQAKWQVTAMCRNIPDNAIHGVNYVQADLLDKASLLNVLPEDVSCLFHTAADTNTWSKNNPRQTQTNVQGTTHLIDAATQKNCQKFVHVSSITTFGVDHQGMVELKDDSKQDGINSWVNYVKTKSQAEQLIKQQAKEMNAVVVNPTHIIGPDDQQNWIRLFKMMIADSLPTIPSGSGSFVDVRDVARGCILAAEKGLAGKNYILGGHNLSFKQFIEQVSGAFDIEVTQRNKPLALLKTVAKISSAIGYITGKAPDLSPESLHLISDQFKTFSQGAKNQLGYGITPLQNTLSDIKKDLQQRGILSA